MKVKTRNKFDAPVTNRATKVLITDDNDRPLFFAVVLAKDEKEDVETIMMSNCLDENFDENLKHYGFLNEQ